MEFLPHTQDALDEYLGLADPDVDLERSLRSMADSVTGLVPDCVGLSLTLCDHDLTFTLVAPTLPPARTEAVPQGEDGPSAASTERDPRTGGELLDEDRWASFARASAAAGVASSLFLPVLDSGQVVSGITLYASSAEAFTDRQQDLAATVGAEAAGAVMNADLAFETRQRAEQAPERLRAQQVIEVGVGILAAREGLDVETARTRLSDAAARAGIDDAQAAMVLVDVHRG